MVKGQQPSSGDSRFSKIGNDPRYKKIAKSQRKVKLDDRFKDVISNPKFTSKYSVDERGRVLGKSAQEDLKKYYRLSDSDEDDEDDGEEEVKDTGDSQSESNEEEEEEEEKAAAVQKKRKKKKQSSGDKQPSDSDKEADQSDEDSEFWARARGQADDSSSDEEITFSKKKPGSEIVHDWAEFDTAVDRTEELTNRLAVCNVDWDRVGAKDLLVLLNSFKPRGGYVKAVQIYPSEYGKERLAKEDVLGPLEILKKNPSVEDGGQDIAEDGLSQEEEEDNYGDDDDDDDDDSAEDETESGEEEDDDGDSASEGGGVDDRFDMSKFAGKGQLGGDGDEDDDGDCSDDSGDDSDGLDMSDSLGKTDDLSNPSKDNDRDMMEKIRQYQLNRMKYFYAVVVCDTTETASALYEQCDGMEVELSQTRLDLRFIPDDMTFDDAPKETAAENDAIGYEPLTFFTSALQQSKVNLTWDETDRTRLKTTMRKFTTEDLNDNDFKAYLASSGSEGDPGSDSSDDDDSDNDDYEAGNTEDDDEEEEESSDEDDDSLMAIQSRGEASADSSADSDEELQAPVRGQDVATLTHCSKSSKSRSMAKPTNSKSGRASNMSTSKKSPSSTSAAAAAAAAAAARPSATKKKEKESTGPGTSKGKAKGKTSYDKYRALMDEINAKENADNEGQEMEIVFDGTEFGQDSDKKKKKSAKSCDGTAWEQYLKDKKKKQRQRKKQGAGDADSDQDEVSQNFDFNDDFFTDGAPSKTKKTKKKKKGALTEEEKKEQDELKLLMLDKEDDSKKHFSLKGIMEDEKQAKGSGASRKRRRKRKHEADDDTVNNQASFKMDLDDPRFAAVYSESRFAIDPTAPQFKKTKGMEDLVAERHRRRKEQRAEDEEKEQGRSRSESSSSQHRFSSMVKSAKAKAGNYKSKKSKKA